MSSFAPLATATPDAPLEVAFAELRSLPEHSFLSSWLELDENLPALFERATLLDPEADETGYPAGLVEGFHLLALLDRQFSPCIAVDDGVAWNYGLDRVRFLRPVTTRLRVRAKGTFGPTRPHNQGVVMPVAAEVETDLAPGPSMVVQWLVYWAERDR